MKQFLIGISLFLSLFWSNAVHAAGCTLRLSTQNISIAWNQSFNFKAVGFRVTKTRGPACNFSVTFSRGCATTYDRRMILGANTLRYQLFKDAGLSKVLKDFPDAASPDEFISGSFPEGTNLTQAFTYYVQIPLDLATQPALKPKGTYTDMFIVRVFNEAVPSSTAVVKTSTVRISTTIPKIIEISLVDTGASFNPSQTTRTVDFGTIVEGASQGFDLKVRTNAGFSVKFSSRNRGSLKHSMSSVRTKVPYSLKVNQVPKDLSTAVVVATGSGQTALEGVANSVLFTVASPASSIAGQYSDFITVTATSTE